MTSPVYTTCHKRPAARGSDNKAPPAGGCDGLEALPSMGAVNGMPAQINKFDSPADNRGVQMAGDVVVTDSRVGPSASTRPNPRSIGEWS